MLNRYEYMMRDITDKCDAYEVAVDAAVKGDVDKVADKMGVKRQEAAPKQEQTYKDTR